MRVPTAPLRHAKPDVFVCSPGLSYLICQESASFVSFADAPAATAQAAHVVDPAAQLCAIIPTSFDDGAATSSSTPGSAEGARVATAVDVDFLSLSLERVAPPRVDVGVGDAGANPLSASSPDPLAGITLIDALPLAGAGREGEGESTAWELSSSSGEDETNALSATRWAGFSIGNYRIGMLYYLRALFCFCCVCDERVGDAFHARISRVVPVLSSCE